jgi:16S rRNA (cytidine1402-2'-O)-methyltransferase
MKTCLDQDFIGDNLNKQTEANPVEKPGVLYLCATPIGNLEDITFRVLRILKEVDLVAAEDTRRTRGLLSHYGISKPLTSYYQHNQRHKGAYLIEQLLRGQSIALVSDAGTPGISDPGEELVRQALTAGISVFALPGPSVVPVALSISGLATQRFVFEGFLPRSRGEKNKRIQELASESRTLVLFEAPHRLLKTLSLLLEVWGSRRAAVVREASKKFEEVVRGTLGEIIEHFQVHLPRGEITLVIEGYSGILGLMSDGRIEAGALSSAEVIDEVIMEVAIRVESGENPRDVIRELAQEKKLNRRDLYQAWIQVR